MASARKRIVEAVSLGETIPDERVRTALRFKRGDTGYVIADLHRGRQLMVIWNGDKAHLPRRVSTSAIRFVDG